MAVMTAGAVITSPGPRSSTIETTAIGGRPLPIAGAAPEATGIGIESIPECGTEIEGTGIGTGIETGTEIETITIPSTERTTGTGTDRRSRNTENGSRRRAA